MATYPVCARVLIETRDLVDRAAAEAGFSTRGDWLAHVIDRALAGAGYIPADDVPVRREERDARRNRGPRPEYPGHTAERDARDMVARALALGGEPPAEIP